MKQANLYRDPPPGEEIRIVPASEVPPVDPLAQRFPFQRAPGSEPFTFEYSQGQSGLRLRLVQFVKLGRNVLRRVLHEGRAAPWGVR